MNYIYYLLILFGVIFLVVFIIGFLLAKKLCCPPRFSHQRALLRDEKNGLITLDWYEKLEKQIVYIDSPYKYKLYCEFIERKENTNKTVVITHGYRVNLGFSVKYGKMFLEMGYNVLWYDNAASGKSEGKVVTMGYREKDDLGAIIKWLREKDPDMKIGIHGESMGASLSMMYGAFDNNLSFIIEDCGYSSLREELVFQFKNKLRLPVFPFYYVAEWFVKLIAGFSAASVNPIKLFNEDNALSQIPMLFIHGDSDNFTPLSMVNDLYNAKKGIKELYIAKGADHAESFYKNPLKYYNTVADFLKKINFN